MNVHWDHGGAGVADAGFEIASNAGEAPALMLPIARNGAAFTPPAGVSFMLGPFGFGSINRAGFRFDPLVCSNDCNGRVWIAKVDGRLIEETFVAKTRRSGDAPERPLHVDVSGACAALCEGPRCPP